MEEITKQCAEITIKAGYGSIALIQRELIMGYTQAAEQMEILEKWGVVGPFKGNKNREVLVKSIDEISEPKPEQKATLSENVGIYYENPPLTDDEISEAIRLRKMRDLGKKMTQFQMVKLQNLFNKSFKHTNELNLSGYAGINSDGTIVDRRKFPKAIPVQKNELFGVVEPKKLT